MDNRQKNKDDISFPWYFKTWAIVLAIFIGGPLGLFLLWMHPKMKMWIKVSATILVFFITIWTVIGTVEFYREMTARFEELAKVMNGQ